jgi:molybdopterin/thiamine biosynthesis adenylyltransferase
MASSAQTEIAARSSTFVVVGAGGLGCPALLGLLASGARRVSIVDHDVVELSNLQRQVLYTVGDVGMSKVDAARLELRRRCAELEVQTHRTRITTTGADAFVASLDPGSVLLECTDAPALKFALNDAALAHDVPIVIGAALGLRGQALAVRRGAACYRCIYESPPSDAPTCAAAGVLGAAVGLTGFHMASLAWALAEGRTEAAGRLWAVDLRTMLVQSLRPSPRSACDGCVSDPTHLHRGSSPATSPSASNPWSDGPHGPNDHAS